MFESFLAVPLHFTIEFFGFLVMGGGALLVVSRPALIPGSAANRVTAALGFASLAAAQVAHGGSFVETDSEQLLLALHTLGIALILVAVVGSFRGETPSAALALYTPGAFVPAGAAALLAILTLVSAARGGPRAYRRLSLAALLLAASEGLTALTPPQARFGVGEADGFLVGAHITKMLALFALGAWLWSGVRSSIRTRFVASFGVLLVAVVLALSTALTGVISNNIEDEELGTIKSQVENVAGSIEDDLARPLKGDAESLAQFSRLKEGLAGTSRLAGAAADILEIQLFDDIDFLAVYSPGGDLLDFAGDGPIVEGRQARAVPTGLDQSFRLRLTGAEVVVDLTQDDTTPNSTSIVRLDDDVAVLSAQRVVNEADDAIPDGIGRGGNSLGIVVVGRFLDERFVEQVSNDLVTPRASIVVQDVVIASTLARVVERSDLIPEAARSDLEAGRSVSMQQTVGDRSFYSAFAPIEGGQGFPLDATIVLSSPTRIVAETREGVTRILFLVAMGVGAVALMLAWLSGRRITRPIQVLTATARTVREGDLSARAEVSGDDEVGQLGETFNEMTDSLLRLTDSLRGAARQEHDLRERIETIIQSMADGLVAVDADRKILAFNREAEKLTGVRLKSATGRSVDSVLRAQDSQGNPVSLPIHELAEGSIAGVFLERKGADAVPVAVTTAVLRDEEGDTTGAVAVIRDMTREREIERMKSEFLSNISHELRTPLTPIKGYAEILGRKDVPPQKMKQFVAGILESTERLERIVGLLVDFSAMEAGRLSPRVAPVDIGAIVKKLGEDWTGRARQHEVVVDVKARLPKVVGDERLLKRSIEEVIDNAVKFSPSGGRIHLEARATQSGNGRGKKRSVLVSVTDEGIGIPSEDLPKIFSDFHQLDGSETRSYGGLGLGLAFVARIVETHGGHVDVESEPDQGTRFMITIPAATRGR